MPSLQTLPGTNPHPPQSSLWTHLPSPSFAETAIVFPRQRSQKQERNQDTSLIGSVSCAHSGTSDKHLVLYVVEVSDGPAAVCFPPWFSLLRWASGEPGEAWAQPTHSWSLGWGGILSPAAAPGDAKCLALSRSAISPGSLGPTAPPPRSSASSLRPSGHSSCCFSSRIALWPGWSVVCAFQPPDPSSRGFLLLGSLPSFCQVLSIV